MAPFRRPESNVADIPADPADRYEAIRRFTEELCAPLAVEDYVVQSMPDASPAKWHLAHTSWFFETFVLKPYLRAYRPFHEQFNFLFNSYYNAIGPRHCQPRRGLLSRPTVEETYQYRRHVDERVSALLNDAVHPLRREIAVAVELGLQHEQQHQELILTDIKNLFAANPLRPVYRAGRPEEARPAVPLRWIAVEEGLRWIGHDGAGFAFDNESPRHRQWVDAFLFASRPVTNGEYMAFIRDDGYDRPELWLSLGWTTRQEGGWHAPLYWEKRDGHWWTMTLAGLRKVREDEPVCHVSYFEADAFARWAGARLPTEFEWETAADLGGAPGSFAEDGVFHPRPAAPASDGPVQMFGDVWEWTGSPYRPYPGYRPPAGALGEYNGKFMANQMVLRGGSCATPRSHIRATYRNFFVPQARWQFAGIRLAKDK
jgi:ergothioneine biosynthesis protein EgtB